MESQSGTFLAPLLPWQALHFVYLYHLLGQHIFPLPSSCLPVDCDSVLHRHPLFYCQYSVPSFLFCAVMQGPGFITATAAIARERAGRRGRGLYSRHPRPQNPSDAPDVSVSLTLRLRPLLHSDFVLFLHIHVLLFIRGPQTDQAHEYRYEAILLAPGESKIDVEVDTRKSCWPVYTAQPH